MADRRSVYNDPRIIELAKKFVCAADEVWRLQRGSEADCLFFQRMVNGGDRITDAGTRQSAWVCAASGIVLARVNTRNADAMLESLAKGLAAWDELPEDARRLASDAKIDPEHRWEMSCPTDGLVLERLVREIDSEGLAGERSSRWNRDFGWFSADELRSSIPGELEVGQSIDLPVMAERLARFLVVDNARGQTLPYATEEIETAELTARLAARTGAVLELELRGSTRAVADGPWLLGESSWKPRSERPHGIESTLLGRANWDSASSRFVEFSLVGVGRHWGSTVMNARGVNAEPGLVAFHFGLTERRIAPAFIALYDVDWVKHPAVGTWRLSPDEVGLVTR